MVPEPPDQHSAVAAERGQARVALLAADIQAGQAEHTLADHDSQQGLNLSEQIPYPGMVMAGAWAGEVAAEQVAGEELPARYQHAVMAWFGPLKSSVLGGQSQGWCQGKIWWDQGCKRCLVAERRFALAERVLVSQMVRANHHHRPAVSPEGGYVDEQQLVPACGFGQALGQSNLTLLRVQQLKPTLPSAGTTEAHAYGALLSKSKTQV